MTLLLAGQPVGEPVQLGQRRDDTVALVVQHADEFVESSQQLPDVLLTTGERVVEAVYHLSDLTQAATVDHGSQRGERPFGGRV